MARPLKKGLAYFPFDVSTFNELGFRKLRYKFGPLGESVYLRLIAEIYKNSYFLEHNFDDLAFAISDEIGSKWAKCEKIKSIILYCFEVDLFDKNFINNSVMTSKEIQKIYVSVVARRKFKPELYNLLTEQDYKDLQQEGDFTEPQTPVSATQTPVSATQTPVSATEITQRKENQTKENQTKEKKRDSACADLFSSKFKQYFPNKEIDCAIPENIDVDLLIKKIKASPKYLELVPKVSFFLKRYFKIIAGYYDDWNLPTQTKDKIQSREYSTKELQDLFDNLETVEI